MKLSFDTKHKQFDLIVIISSVCLTVEKHSSAWHAFPAWTKQILSVQWNVKWCRNGKTIKYGNIFKEMCSVYFFSFNPFVLGDKWYSPKGKFPLNYPGRNRLGRRGHALILSAWQYPYVSHFTIFIGKNFNFHSAAYHTQWQSMRHVIPRPETPVPVEFLAYFAFLH